MHPVDKLACSLSVILKWQQEYLEEDCLKTLLGEITKKKFEKHWSKAVVLKFGCTLQLAGVL